MSGGSSAREQDIDRQRQGVKDQFQSNLSQSRELRGKVAQNPFFNFDSLRASPSVNISQSDASSQNNLIDLLQGRANEILQQRFQPGSSQTRLSLVE